mgnify:CR=1 FL=1
MKGAKLFVVGEAWEVSIADHQLVHEDVPLIRGRWSSSSLTAQVVRREPDATLAFYYAAMDNGWPCC